MPSIAAWTCPTGRPWRPTTRRAARSLLLTTPLLAAPTFTGSCSFPVNDSAATKKLGKRPGPPGNGRPAAAWGAGCPGTGGGGGTLLLLTSRRAFVSRPVRPHFHRQGHDSENRAGTEDHRDRTRGHPCVHGRDDDAVQGAPGAGDER